mmetsp:Transcript_17055/g.22879  ORF Transcript_17055/g.22879 Transcript_17055/m.22879 type:complete len:149 (-) Transcript_17055:40-486(-)
MKQLDSWFRKTRRKTWKHLWTVEQYDMLRKFCGNGTTTNTTNNNKNTPVTTSSSSFSSSTAIDASAQCQINFHKAISNCLASTKLNAVDALVLPDSGFIWTFTPEPYKEIGDMILDQYGVSLASRRRQLHNKVRQAKKQKGSSSDTEE